MTWQVEFTGPANPRPGLAETEGDTPSASPGVTVVPSVVPQPARIPARHLPNLAGKWKGKDGAMYEMWQDGNRFGWKVARKIFGLTVDPHSNEIGSGTIGDDGNEASGSWTGPLAGQCRARVECDYSGRAVKLVGDNGMALKRVD